MQYFEAILCKDDPISGVTSRHLLGYHTAHTALQGDLNYARDVLETILIFSRIYPQL